MRLPAPRWLVRWCDQRKVRLRYDSFVQFAWHAPEFWAPPLVYVAMAVVMNTRLPGLGLFWRVYWIALAAVSIGLAVYFLRRHWRRVRSTTRELAEGTGDILADLAYTDEVLAHAELPPDLRAYLLARRATNAEIVRIWAAGTMTVAQAREMIQRMEALDRLRPPS